MRIEVLGPIRAEVDGSEVSLGGSQQRLVLALLVEASGRAVTTDQLIDRVWGEAPPDRARKTIQVHVSKLRRALGDDTIETVGGGYRLASHVEVDSAEFERLVEWGRQHLDEQPGRAAELLGEAERLWRGPPYTDLRDEEALQTEIRRVEELRLSALEDRLAAQIAAGDGPAAVPELEGLAYRHPVRERLHGLLMIALYQSGRQPEALATYRRFSDQLVEEYGLEPSPDLQALELAILQQDPSVGPAGGDHPDSPPASRLPARYAASLGHRRVVVPPTGTSSFLFTDMVGSTRLWESDREGMMASLELHDRIMQDAIAAHRGYVFSTTGDGFAAAFPAAEEALSAAVEAQLELLAASWEGPQIEVRMGIHTGSADERSGDYFGPVVNRAARIMSSGHGGQLLVSGSTAGLLADRMPEPTRLVDLGLHRLEDLERPEHLFEIRHPGLPEVTAPIRTAMAPRSNLGEPLTSFVGRAKEMAEIEGLLSNHRLVTLTGVGGSGKTRLSQELARTSADEFDDGVWLVELASVADPSLVIGEIAAVWELGSAEGADLASVVHGYLARRNLLLIVDNCEHLIDRVKDVVGALLAAAPTVRVLATSRESLGVPGEIVYRVPSLELAAEPALATDSDAVRLFLDRAHAARADFVAGEDDLAAIAQVCWQVDGLPLAVELAAARMRSMSPQQLAERLGDSFRILASKSVPPRHRTLNATIEWSHDLLEPESQAVFRRVSVFRGGFDLLAAEPVCVGPGIEEWEIIDRLDDLVGKSLVIADRGPGGATRFRLLEPIRQYGVEKLQEAGETSAIELTHANHYADLCRRAEPELRGPGQLDWTDRLDTEYDNIRTALFALLRVSDLSGYLDVCWHLWMYWGHSLPVEGMGFVTRGLESGLDVDLMRRVRAWYEAALLAYEVSLLEAVDYAERAVELAVELGDQRVLGDAKMVLGTALKVTAGRAEEGRRWFMEGDALHHEHPASVWSDDEWEEARWYWGRGIMYPPDHPDRQPFFQKAIDGFEATGDEAAAARVRLMSFMLRGLADDEWVFGNLSKAVEVSRRTGFRSDLGHALVAWTSMARGRGLLEEARMAALEAESILSDLGDNPCAANAGLNAAKAGLELGLVDEGQADLVRTAHRMAVVPPERQIVARLHDFATAFAVHRGDFETAGRLLGRAEAHELEGRRWDELAALRLRLEAALDRTKLAALVREGAAMVDVEAVELFLEWDADTRVPPSGVTGGGGP